MQKILITGGNGNLAKMIKTQLSSEFDITCITRNDFDMLDPKAVSNYFSNSNNIVDVLIHTAISGGRRGKEETGEVVYQNLLMFENIMLFSHKFQLIINFDSGAIYDRSTDIYCKKESELLSVPTDYYGFSKYLIYKRSLQYKNVVNFRIFNIFHLNEEPNRFIKSCLLAKKNGTNVTIFQDKYFDFMYEDDFIRIVRHYINNFSNNLPKTINLSYTNKYKLSELALMLINNKDQIEIIDSSCSNNYCGDGNMLENLCIGLDGLETGLKKYEELFLV
jgi:UDP-glucose 4-epimerase